MVAIKIQRPGIGEIIETDIAILKSMAERIETVFPETRIYNPSGMVDDFAHQIVKELDYTREARNVDRMARNFRDVPGIRFPKIYWEFTSPHMMVMEFIEGVRIDNPEAITEMGLDPARDRCPGIPCLSQDDLRGRVLPRRSAPG